MPRKHRDNSTRSNLERNLGVSGRKSSGEYELYKRDLERLGEGRNGRPIVDHQLEEEADRAGMTFLRKGNHETIYLEGYGHND